MRRYLSEKPDNDNWNLQWFILVHDKNSSILIFCFLYGFKSAAAIYSKPYLNNDLALFPCFSILIGLIFRWRNIPIRYAHRKAISTMASNFSIRLISVRWVSLMLNPLDLSALKKLWEASHKFFYDKLIIMQSQGVRMILTCWFLYDISLYFT